MACVLDATSQNIGTETPSAAAKLYREKIRPKIIDIKAAFALPFFHKKPRIIGTNAPVAIKSAPIQEIVITLLIFRPISSARTAIINVEIRPIST